MAKILTYERSTQQVVVVDTVAATTTDLGNTIALAETTGAFPNRTENNIAVYRGSPYMLYLSAANEIRLSKYDVTGGTWADEAGFTAITTGSGNLIPQSLHVVKDRLVAVVTSTLTAGIDAVIARRSDQSDATTWDAAVTVNFATQPTDSRAGPSVVWRNAVWFSTSEGIGYYDPDGDTISATFDAGSDSLIVGMKANFGSFAKFDGDLYYVLATDSGVGTPYLYYIDRTWSTAAPTPTFQATGLVIPGVGAATMNNDTGNYSLFVNKTGGLSLLYSGNVESKIVTIQKSSGSYTLSDDTLTVMPSDLSSTPSLGFSFYADDRRRTNEKHTVIVRYGTALPASILLYSWDGTSQMSLVATLDNSGAGLDLMVPEVERGDFRTYTGNEPSAYIDATSQPFPGRVRIDYTIQDESTRPMDVFPEYSIDGQTWAAMTEGDGDDGSESLASSIDGSTSSYFFHWDAFVDLDGDLGNVDIRVIARIAGV